MSNLGGNLGGSTTGKCFHSVWVSDSPVCQVSRSPCHLDGTVLDSVHEWICWACWHERMGKVTRYCCATLLDYLSLPGRY